MPSVGPATPVPRYVTLLVEGRKRVVVDRHVVLQPLCAPVETESDSPKMVFLRDPSPAQTEKSMQLLRDAVSAQLPGMFPAPREGGASFQMELLDTELHAYVPLQSPADLLDMVRVRIVTSNVVSSRSRPQSAAASRPPSAAASRPHSATPTTAGDAMAVLTTLRVSCAVLHAVAVDPLGVDRAVIESIARQVVAFEASTDAAPCPPGANISSTAVARGPEAIGEVLGDAFDRGRATVDGEPRNPLAETVHVSEFRVAALEREFETMRRKVAQLEEENAALRSDQQQQRVEDTALSSSSSSSSGEASVLDDGTRPAVAAPLQNQQARRPLSAAPQSIDGEISAPFPVTRVALYFYGHASVDAAFEGKMKRSRVVPLGGKASIEQLNEEARIAFGCATSPRRYRPRSAGNLRPTSSSLALSSTGVGLALDSFESSPNGDGMETLCIGFRLAQERGDATAPAHMFQTDVALRNYLSRQQVTEKEIPVVQVFPLSQFGPAIAMQGALEDARTQGQDVGSSPGLQTNRTGPAPRPQRSPGVAPPPCVEEEEDPNDFIQEDPCDDDDAEEGAEATLRMVAERQQQKQQQQVKMDDPPGTIPVTSVGPEGDELPSPTEDSPSALVVSPFLRPETALGYRAGSTGASDDVDDGAPSSARGPDGRFYASVVGSSPVAVLEEPLSTQPSPKGPTPNAIVVTSPDPCPAPPKTSTCGTAAVGQRPPRPVSAALYRADHHGHLPASSAATCDGVCRGTNPPATPMPRPPTGVRQVSLQAAGVAIDAATIDTVFDELRVHDPIDDGQLSIDLLLAYLADRYPDCGDKRRFVRLLPDRCVEHVLGRPRSAAVSRRRERDLGLRKDRLTEHEFALVLLRIARS